MSRSRTLGVRAAIIALTLLCALPSAAATADDPSGWWVRCGGPFQLCGYVQQGTQAPRIPFRFEAAKPFRDGLAAIRIDGRWGYIDRSGDLVIEPTYTDAAPFYGELAEVRVNDAAGIIDRRGRMVVPARFKRIIPFADDVFVAVPLESTSRSGGYLGPETDSGALTGFGSAGLYHRRDGWVTDTDLQFTAFDPARGLIWAGRRNERSEEVWGLMRTDGSWQVTPRYSYVQRLIGNRAIVRSMPDHSLTYPARNASVLSGAVDEDGDLVIPLEFAWLGYWRAGYGLASRTGGAPGFGQTSGEPNAGIVTPDGALLGGRYFDEVSVPEEDGLLPRVRLGQVWHSVSPGGELLPDQLDGTALLDCPGGLSFIRRGRLVEVRTSGGEPVGLYDSQHLSPGECPGPFSLRRDGGWFILMPDGAVLGGERGFENLYQFDGEHAPVQLDGKWGIIDRRGEFTVSPRFDDLRSVGRGVFRTGGGGEARWIDARGRSVPEPEPTRPEPATALACQGGLVLFRSNGRWGLKDAQGNTVIRPEHRALTCFRHGSAWAAAPEGREWCPIGSDGERRRAFRCRETVYPLVVTHHVPEAFDEDPFESSVLWNMAYLDHLAGTRPEAPKWIPDGAGRGSYSVMDGLPAPELAEAATGPGALRTAAPYGIGAGLVSLVALVAWKRRRSGRR